MGCRPKQTLVVFLVSFILICILVARMHECYIPLSLMQLYKTPVKLHKTTCPTSGIDKSIDLDMIQPDIDKIIPRYVVHVHKRGQIGNLMFQTASTFGIAATLKYKTYIEESHPLLTYFEMNPFTRIDLTNNVVLTEEECMDNAWRCRKEIYFHNVTVEGWLQSWKYFHHIAPTIRKHFTIKSFYRDQAKTFLKAIKIQNSTVIGIHARRNDFGSFYLSRCGYTMATPGYFHRAMQLYRREFKNVIFVVVSDSMMWCRENIVAIDVIYSHFTDPVTDLALMSMCDHMIISGGTFGFWGAWLAGGKVIYPKDWPRPGSWLDRYGMIIDDFWLPDWIGITNSAAIVTTNISILTILLQTCVFIFR